MYRNIYCDTAKPNVKYDYCNSFIGFGINKFDNRSEITLNNLNRNLE